MNIKTFEVGPFGVNTYVLWDESTKKAAIVDPSMGSESVLLFINEESLDLAYIINTHGHVDHVAGNAYFKANGGTPEQRPFLLIHEADLPLLRNAVRQALSFGVKAEQAPEPDQFIKEGDVIEIGDGKLTVLHTPGHSPGGVCLLAEGMVLVGDTLFFGSIGRTDFPGASHQQLIQSVRTKLFVLPDETKAYPGHGPATTLGFEKQYNPFFQGQSPSGLWLP